MSDPPQLALERVEHLRHLGRYPDAEREARVALAQRPDDAALLAALAAVLRDTGRRADGLEAADAAVAADPSAEWGHRLRALLLGELGRHADAIAASSTAVALQPHSPYSALGHAVVLQQAGQLAAAADEARRAIALDPGNAEGHLLLADIADDLGDRRTARHAYQQVLRINPDHAIARHDLAVLDVNSRRLKAGLQGLLDAGAAAPELTLVLRNVANVLWKLSWRLRMGLIVSVLAVVTASNRGRTNPADPWAARIAAGIVLGICALLIWRSIRQLPTNARPVIREALRRDRSLRFTYLALALCLGIFGTIVITGIAPLAVIVWLALGVLGCVALWARFRDRRS